MKLMIVEGPGKIPTLKKILGPDWKVMATNGHLRELSEDNGGYGFNFTDFQPSFAFIEGKRAVMNNIINTAKDKNCETIYIAGDPDREGEAISWHIYDLLPTTLKNKSKRVDFHELTKPEIEKAINNPREIDQNLVDAQFARSVLDKLFGYKASDAVRRSGVGGTSAGRVQSMALKLIDDRRKEIENFKEENWYEVIPVLENGLKLTYKVKDEKGKLLTKEFTTKEEAENFVKTLNDNYVVSHVSDKVEKKTAAPKPFKTSDVFQLADRLGTNVDTIKNILQVMYEKAITTYPRTDSRKIRPEFCEQITKYVVDNYGKNYASNGYAFNDKVDDNSQEGHDAIRPTDINATPEKLSATLSAINPKAKALYEIIWNRTVASCMADAKFDAVDIEFDNNKNKFYATSKIMTFDGFKKVYNLQDNIDGKNKKSDDDSNDNVVVGDIKPKQSFKCINKNEILKEKKTLPPKPYTEATLVAMLEKKGIGRPSTIPTMLKINITRGYVRKEDKYLVINQMGIDAIKFIDKYFADVINENYTRDMEKDLDKIANGKLVWVDGFIKPFYEKLKITLINFENSLKDMINNVIPNSKNVKYYDKCPKCGGDVVVKVLPNNKYMQQCLNGSYDAKTKKTVGCDWVNWISSYNTYNKKS